MSLLSLLILGPSGLWPLLVRPVVFDGYSMPMWSSCHCAKRGCSAAFPCISLSPTDGQGLGGMKGEVLIIKRTLIKTPVSPDSFIFSVYHGTFVRIIADQFHLINNLKLLSGIPFDLHLGTLCTGKPHRKGSSHLMGETRGSFWSSPLGELLQESPSSEFPTFNVLGLFAFVFCSSARPEPSHPG